MMKFINIALTIIFSCYTIHSSAIVIRHDVEDKHYRAEVKDFPPLATLYTVGAHGTLIAPQWVLTAGHTIFCADPGARIKIGNQWAEIDSRYTHAKFRKRWWNGDKHDISLLKLKSPVQGIKPAKLYSHTDELNQQVWFIGEGGTGNGNSGQTKTYRDGKLALRKAQNAVSSVSDGDIMFTFEKGNAGLPLEGVSGNGDSGGPAFKIIDGDYYLLGVSSRVGGGSEGKYGVKEIYSRVSYYRQWINQVILEDEEHIANYTSQYHYAEGDIADYLPQVCEKIGL